MADTEQSGPATRKQRSRAACKQCRQSKVKCGMEKVPCARCKRLHYHCEWDPSFKRAKTQDRFQELEKQIRSLQNVGPADPFAGIHQKSPSHASPVDDAAVAWTTSVSADVSDEDDTCFAVLDIKLSPQDADSLFKKFFHHYHVHVPFLEPSRSPATIYQNSELLFWSIISVAAREHQPCIDFLSRLSPYFTTPLAGLIFGRRSSLNDIQALLLLSLWPPSNITLHGDKSITIASLAVTEAMTAGLHNPSYEQEYTNKIVVIPDLERSERTRTWIACVAVAQNLAMDAGIPLHLPFSNWTLQETCTLVASPTIPSDLQHYLIIQRSAYSALHALPQRGAPATEGTFDQALTDQAQSVITDLRERFDAILPSMSLLNRLRLATAKLHIQSMHFLTSPSSPHRKQKILEAYETATTIITWYISEEGSNDILTYSPRTTLPSLLIACYVIYAVLHSSYSSDLDYSSGKVLFNAALLCFRLQAVQYRERKDLPLRCVDMLRGLWRLSENRTSLKDAPPELSIQTRQGASLFHHGLALFFDRLALLHNNRRGMNTTLPSPGDFDAIAMLDLDALGDLPLDYDWGALVDQDMLQDFH